MIAHCNACKWAGVEPFAVPWDECGAAIMEEHIREKHPEIKRNRPDRKR